jgi:hypothetical protein
MFIALKRWVLGFFFIRFKIDYNQTQIEIFYSMTSRAKMIPSNIDYDLL